MFKINKIILFLIACLCFFSPYLTANDSICFTHLKDIDTSDYTDVTTISNKGFTGLGKFYVANKGCFVGEFKNGFPNGNGMIVWPDLSYYKGNFKAGAASGYGEFSHRFNWIYRGTWVADWPDIGVCEYLGEKEDCHAKRSSRYFKQWNKKQPISISILHERYFYEFNLLSQTDRLRPGFIFKNKEYDLNSDKSIKSNVYYAGSKKRTKQQMKKSMSYHVGFLKEMLDKYNDDAQKNKATITIDPRGQVTECVVKSMQDKESLILSNMICNELRLIDFGVVDSKDNITLVINI